MEHAFIGSLIPLLCMCVHSLKSFEIYTPLYAIVYMCHLSGRPLYLGVEKWYQLQRAFELCLFIPYKQIVCLLFIVGAQIHKASLYGLFVYNSNQFLLSTILLFIICLHQLPVQEKKVKEYFWIRMAKNIMLAIILFMKSNLLWSALIPMIVLTVLYFCFCPNEKIEREYFLNPIPSTYPVPLDIKDAIKHCKTAKILFKKNAV